MCNECAQQSLLGRWKARGPRRNADRRGDSAGVAPSTPHPRPAMLPGLSPAMGEGGVRVSQLLVNTPLFKPLSQPCLCASERPSSWAWSGRSGWGKHAAGGGTEWASAWGAVLHLVTSPWPRSEAPQSPPPLRPPRDVEIQKAFSVMFYF